MKKIIQLCCVVILLHGCGSDDQPNKGPSESETINEYLSDNELIFTTTSQGVYQYVITPNPNGNNSGDVFSIYYTASNLETGELIESHLSTNGDPIKLLHDAGSIFPRGLDHGLSGIRVGETYGLIIPSKLGYSGHSTEAVAADVLMHFEVEVINRESVTDIAAVENTAINNYIVTNDLNNLALNPIDNVVSLSDNIRYKRTGAGTGGSPKVEDTVKVDYSTRLLNGTLVDELSNLKFRIGVGEVFKGFDASIFEMEIGERALFIFPSSEAYGASVRVVPESAIPELINQNVVPVYASKVKPFEVLTFDITLNSIEPIPNADISVVKTVNNSMPNIASDVIFTLTTGNIGPNNATGVVVTDALPTGYTYVSDDGGSTGSTSEANGIVTWEIGKQRISAVATLRITAKVNGSGSYTNTAMVSGFDDDPNLADNTSSVTVVPISAESDLSITKTANDNTPTIGSNLTFTLTANNSGPSDATGVVVTDVLPSGYTYVSNNGGSIGSVTQSNGTVTWTIANLDTDANATLTITATVNASGTYTNAANIAGMKVTLTPLIIRILLHLYPFLNMAFYIKEINY